MESNKYIYIKETDQIAGPLQMDKPVKKHKGMGSIGSATCDYCGRESSSDLYQMEHYCVTDKWEDHIKSLPRIEYIGEPFEDEQILEEGKDIEIKEVWINGEDAPKDAAFPIVVSQKNRARKHNSEVVEQIKQVQEKHDMKDIVEAKNGFKNLPQCLKQVQKEHLKEIMKSDEELGLYEDNGPEVHATNEASVALHASGSGDPIEEAAEDYAALMVWINKGHDNEQEFYEYISAASFKAGAEWAGAQEDLLDQTGVIRGNDAIRFRKQMEENKNKKVSPEELARIKKAAEEFKAITKPASQEVKGNSIEQEKQTTNMENNIPRRINVQLWTPAEKMIQDAVWEVETMGADVKLTLAVILLLQARAAVADFVDGVKSTSQEAKGKTPHTDDDLLGELIGEIAWLKVLREHTESNVVNGKATDEEKAEYARLNEQWYSRVEGRDANSAPLEWQAYRDYARGLCLKYMPHTIEFHQWIYFKPQGIELFAKGIERFLWNTDACSYRFTSNDIKIEAFDKRSTYNLKITFTHDYLTEKTDKAKLNHGTE